MTHDAAVRRNEYGFYELVDKPTPEELRQYYADKYYQSGAGEYQAAGYSREEVEYFRAKIEQKDLIVQRLLGATGDDPARLLDVGAGEGWTLRHYTEQGWECVGIDFSNVGMASHNPDLLDDLITGDIHEALENLDGTKPFDVLWLDNVLEHVREPLDLLTQLRRLANPGAVLVIEVPNDFSRIQQHLLDEGKVSRPFWIAVPDHLSYFNKSGLTALTAAAGWTTQTVVADYPIDFDLFNPHTNYIMDRSIGKMSHRSRVEIENLIHSISPTGANKLYEALADLGLGRQIIAFCTPQA